MGPRAVLDGRKISSQPGFDPGQSSPQSVAILTELQGPHSDQQGKVKVSPLQARCGTEGG